jgi:hypothetical protein
MTARFLIHLREWTPNDAGSSSLNELLQDTRVVSADDGPIEFRSITPRDRSVGRDGNEEDNAVAGAWPTSRISKISAMSMGENRVRRRPSAESSALRNKWAAGARMDAELEDNRETKPAVSLAWQSLLATGRGSAYIVLEPTGLNREDELCDSTS